MWYRTGKHRSEETKQKIREKLIWVPTWRKGLKMTEEQKRKLSESCKWRKARNKWIARDEATKKKISEKLKSISATNTRYWRKHTNEAKEKISNCHKWKETWNKGKPFLAMETNPMRKWWLSFQPYTTDRTKTLKRSIRERDHYACQMCWEQQTDKAFPIHHINYQKHNCNPENLVTLCPSCHSKTNTNRDRRQKLFELKMRIEKI